MQRLLDHNLPWLNLGIAIHLPLCSKPSCVSFYKARFPDSDIVGGSGQRHEATVTNPVCQATGLDVAKNPPWVSAQSGPVMSSWVTLSNCSCRPASAGIYLCRICRQGYGDTSDCLKGGAGYCVFECFPFRLSQSVITNGKG